MKLVFFLMPGFGFSRPYLLSGVEGIIFIRSGDERQ